VCLIIDRKNFFVHVFCRIYSIAKQKNSSLTQVRIISDSLSSLRIALCVVSDVSGKPPNLGSREPMTGKIRCILNVFLVFQHEEKESLNSMGMSLNMNHDPNFQIANSIF